MSLSLCQIGDGNQFIRSCKSAVVSSVAAPVIKGQPAVYHVKVTETVMFPEGGGQPGDKGTFVYADGTVVDVVDVQRINGDIVHVCKSNAKVEDIAMHVDWKHRMDVLQQHSSQHLISAVFRQGFNCATASWNMTVYPNPSVIEIDISEIQSFDTSAFPESIQEDQAVLQDEYKIAVQEGGLVHGMTSVVPQIVALLIAADIPLKVYVFPDAAAANASDYLKEKRTKPIHESVTGPVRFVEMVGLELNPCCGTHAAHLSQLGNISILNINNGPKSTTVTFVAGSRLVEQTKLLHQEQKKFIKLLSSGTDLAGALERTLVLSQDRAKTIATVKTRLAEEIAARLQSNATSSLVEYNEVTADLQMLTDIAASVWAAAEAKGIKLVVLAGDGVFLLRGEPDAVKKAGAVYAGLVKGKGGGRPGTFQGKGEQMSNHPEAVAAIQQ